MELDKELQKNKDLENEYKKKIKDGIFEVRPFSNNKWSKYSHKKSKYILTPKYNFDELEDIYEESDNGTSEDIDQDPRKLNMSENAIDDQIKHLYKGYNTEDLLMKTEQDRRVEEKTKKRNKTENIPEEEDTDFPNMTKNTNQEEPSKLYIPSEPTVSSEPKIPNVPEMPEIPEMPDMSETSDNPEMPEIPEMPAMPEMPEMPEMSDLGDVL